MRSISRFGRFHKDFPLKEETKCVPLPFSRNRPENHSHNLGKALGKGLSLLCVPFSYLYLSPLYPFHISLSLSLSLSISLSLSLSLSLLSLPPSLYLSFYLSFSLSTSLCLLSIILFGVSNGRFCPCYIKYCRVLLQYYKTIIKLFLGKKRNYTITSYFCVILCNVLKLYFLERNVQT